jgi:Ca-activated chloride channel family protein
MDNRYFVIVYTTVWYNFWVKVEIHDDFKLFKIRFPYGKHNPEIRGLVGNNHPMSGHRFTKFNPPPKSQKGDFDQLFKVFMQLVLITSGDIGEALQWLTEVDRQYKLTNENYGIGDFIEDLRKKGFITQEGPNGEFKLNAKGEQNLRQSALEEIFGKLKKSKGGEHATHHSGRGD